MANTPDLNKTQTSRISSFKTKSAQIRYLHSEGLTNGEISRVLTAVHGKLVRPQHVSNVLRTEVQNPTEK